MTYRQLGQCKRDLLDRIQSKRAVCGETLAYYRFNGVIRKQLVKDTIHYSDLYRWAIHWLYK